jgi:hypothetical protein
MIPLRKVVIEKLLRVRGRCGVIVFLDRAEVL